MQGRRNDRLILRLRRHPYYYTLLVLNALLVLTSFLTPAIRCSLYELHLNSLTFSSPNYLSAIHLSAPPRRRPSSPPRDNYTIHVLRWHYADAPRFPITDSQASPRTDPSCSSYCTIRELHLPSHVPLPRSDLVLLSPHDHGRAFANEWCVHPYPAPFVSEPHTALWATYTYENVAQFPMLADPTVTSRIDLTINYRRDSSIPISWMCPSDGGSFASDYLAPPRLPKTHVVAVVASRCRNDWSYYVRALAALVPLTSYGKCFPSSRNVPCARLDSLRRCTSSQYEDKIAELSKSHFVLVFENTRGVTDYVTEKLSHALLAGSVPVIWGAPNVAQWLPHPDCCIIVNPQLTSPAALAATLKYYSANTTAYLARFFEWKSRPLPASFQTLVKQCYLTSGCRICDHLKSLHSN